MQAQGTRYKQATGVSKKKKWASFKGGRGWWVGGAPPPPSGAELLKGALTTPDGPSQNGHCPWWLNPGMLFSRMCAHLLLKYFCCCVPVSA